jgi:hypothetical protein
MRNQGSLGFGFLAMIGLLHPSAASVGLAQSDCARWDVVVGRVLKLLPRQPPKAGSHRRRAQLPSAAAADRTLRGTRCHRREDDLPEEAGVHLPARARGSRHLGLCAGDHRLARDGAPRRCRRVPGTAEGRTTLESVRRGTPRRWLSRPQLPEAAPEAAVQTPPRVLAFATRRRLASRPCCHPHGQVDAGRGGRLRTVSTIKSSAAVWPCRLAARRNVRLVRLRCRQRARKGQPSRRRAAVQGRKCGHPPFSGPISTSDPPVARGAALMELPARKSLIDKEIWLAALDDFRNYLILAA